MVEPFAAAAARRRCAPDRRPDRAPAPATSALPSAAGTARTSMAAGPKRSIARPSSASCAGALLQPVAVRLVEFDHFGHQQRLAGATAPRRSGGAQPFEHQPFVRGVLIDDDQAVLGLGDDIGRWRPARARRRADSVGAVGLALGRFGARGGRRHDRRFVAAPRPARLATPAERMTRARTAMPSAGAGRDRLRLPAAPSPARHGACALRWPALVERMAQPADDQARARRPDRGSGPRSWPGGR